LRGSLKNQEKRNSTADEREWAQMKNTDKTGDVQGLKHFITLPSAFILFICG
jgi:hypothetical protein